MLSNICKLFPILFLSVGFLLCFNEKMHSMNFCFNNTHTQDAVIDVQNEPPFHISYFISSFPLVVKGLCFKDGGHGEAWHVIVTLHSKINNS